jgi:hypothetical protein
VLQHRRWAHCREGSDQNFKGAGGWALALIGNTEAGRTNPHRLRLYLEAQNGDFKSPAEVPAKAKAYWQELSAKS